MYNTLRRSSCSLAVPRAVPFGNAPALLPTPIYMLYYCAYINKFKRFGNCFQNQLPVGITFSKKKLVETK